MKRKKSLLIHAVCRNCGTPLHGRYCHCCGQDIIAGTRKSAKEMMFTVLENIFTLDNKIFSTLRCLILRPGKLSHEYRSGHIARYVYPSKFFWFITILFFTLLSVHLKNTLKEERIRDAQKNEVVRAENSETKPESTSPVLAAKENDSQENNHFISGDADFNEKFVSYITGYAPYVVLILIPFFAMLLSWFFRKEGYFYADHLAFALHFHSFVFLLFGVYLGLHRFFPWIDFPVIVYILIPSVYSIIALYVFYRPRKWALAWKIIGLNFVYFLTVSIILIVLVIVLAAQLDPELFSERV